MNVIVIVIVITNANDVIVIVLFDVNVSGVLFLDAVTAHHLYSAESALQQHDDIEIAGSIALFVVVILAPNPNLKVNRNLNPSRVAKVHLVLNQVRLHLSL